MAPAGSVPAGGSSQRIRRASARWPPVFWMDRRTGGAAPGSRGGAAAAPLAFPDLVDDPSGSSNFCCCGCGALAFGLRGGIFAAVQDETAAVQRNLRQNGYCLILPCCNIIQTKDRKRLSYGERRCFEDL